MTHFSSFPMTQAACEGTLESIPCNNRCCEPYRFALFRILNGEGVGMSAPLTFIAAHTHPTFGTSGPFSTAPRLAHLMSSTSSRKSLFSSEQLNLPTYGVKAARGQCLARNLVYRRDLVEKNRCWRAIAITINNPRRIYSFRSSDIDIS